MIAFVGPAVRRIVVFVVGLTVFVGADASAADPPAKKPAAATEKKPTDPKAKKPPTKPKFAKPVGPLKPLTPLGYRPAPMATIAVDPLPDYLSGATVYLPIVDAANPLTYHDGKSFVGMQPGLYLAACTWEPEGDLSGFWESSVVTPRGMLLSKWFPLQTVRLTSPAVNRPLRYFLFFQDFKTGWTFEKRTGRTAPPLLIQLADGKKLPELMSLESEPAWPDQFRADLLGNKVMRLLDAEDYDRLTTWTGQIMQGGDRLPTGIDKLDALTRMFDFSHFPLHRKASMERFNGLALEWFKRAPNSLPAAALAIRSHIARAHFLEFHQWNEPDVVDDCRRQALEMINDFQAAHPESRLPHELTLEMARTSAWTMELVDEFVDRMLDAKLFCPEALVEAFNRYRRIDGEQPGENMKAKYYEFFRKIADKSSPEDADALYAWITHEVNWVYYHTEYGYDMDVERAFRGYETILRRYPEARYFRKVFCKTACLLGKRELAARLFAELGPFDAEGERVFMTDGQIASYRAWAAPDCLSGEQRAVFESTNDEPMTARWEPDGKQVLFGDAHGAFWMLDTATGKRELYMIAHQGAPGSRHPAAALITPDGSRLILGTLSGHVGVARREEHDEKKRWFYSGSAPQVTAIALNPQKRWLTVASARPWISAYVANTAIGKKIPKFGTVIPGADLLYLDYLDAKTDRFISYDWNGDVRLWHMTPPKPESYETRPAHAKPGYGSAILSPDHTKLATYGGDRALRVWNVETGELLNEFNDLPRTICCLRFSPDGKLLAGGEGNADARPSNAHLWNLAEKRLVKTFQGHKASVSCLDFSPDGRTLLTSGFDMTLRLWDLPSLN